ncbi:MAG: hypothetical protein R2787_01485 [Saprospiraceae bacterium]
MLSRNGSPFKHCLKKNVLLLPGSGCTPALFPIPADLFDPADQEASLHQLGMKPGTATAVQTIPEWMPGWCTSLESSSPGSATGVAT